MLLSCGEKVVCLQLKLRVSIRNSKCYIKNLKLPENLPKNENIQSFSKIGWRSRCDIPDCFTTYKGKLFCNCKFDDRVPEKEINFLKDQRLSRKMILTSSKDMMFNKHKTQIFAKRPNPSDFIEEQPTCSKISK